MGESGKLSFKGRSTEPSLDDVYDFEEPTPCTVAPSIEAPEAERRMAVAFEPPPVPYVPPPQPGVIRVRIKMRKHAI
jgi:hypothetical protein